MSEEWSSRQGCEFSGVKAPVPSITCFGWLAYPRHAEVTRHDVLGRKSHKTALQEIAVVGATRVASKTERPEHKEMAATSKIPSAVKSLERNLTVRRPIALLGKADAAGEVTGKSNLRTVVVGAQASRERLAEITSGRSRWHQGLVATCPDSSNEAIAEGGRARWNWRMSSYER